MRGWVIAWAAVGFCTAAPATAEPPHLVDHTEWVGGASLRIFPTLFGRTAAGQVGAGVQGEAAWREVLALAPDADTPGMREQFLCHWQFAEFARPGKTSWNLEPWRPVVDGAVMVDSGCNPGGAEETL